MFGSLQQNSLQTSQQQYTPTTVFDTLPEIEKIKYENKEKHLEKNREKNRLLQQRKIQLLTDVDARIERLTARNRRMQGTIAVQKDSFDCIAETDRQSWDSAEEVDRFLQQLKTDEAALAINTHDALGEQHAKAEQMLAAIEQVLQRLKNTLCSSKSNLFAQKSVSNTLGAQSEAYAGVVHKYFALAEQLEVLKKQHREHRKNLYQDHRDPFQT